MCELLARNVKQLSGQIGNDRDKSAVIRTNIGTIRNARCTTGCNKKNYTISKSLSENIRNTSGLDAGIAVKPIT